MRVLRVRKWCTVRKLSNENYGSDRTVWSRTSRTGMKAARVGELILGKRGVTIRHLSTALELSGKVFRY